MTKKFIHQTQKAVTARFSISDYLKIQNEAEKLGTTLADVLRLCWKDYENKNAVTAELKELESNIIKNVFEVCCAVSGLNSEDRNDAKNELKNVLRGKNYE